MMYERGIRPEHISWGTIQAIAIKYPVIHNSPSPVTLTLATSTCEGPGKEVLTLRFSPYLIPCTLAVPAAVHETSQLPDMDLPQGSNPTRFRPLTLGYVGRLEWHDLSVSPVVEPYLKVSLLPCPLLLLVQGR